MNKLIGNVSRENLYPTDSLHVVSVLVRDQDVILDKERLVQAPVGRSGCVWERVKMKNFKSASISPPFGQHSALFESTAYLKSTQWTLHKHGRHKREV